MTKPNDDVLLPLRALARHEHSDHSVASDAAERIEYLWRLNDAYRCQIGALESQLEGERETVDGLNEQLAQRGREIERLRAGGCARDQRATQYCAEATELARELERIKVALANALSERDRLRTKVTP